MTLVAQSDNHGRGFARLRLFFFKARRRLGQYWRSTLGHPLRRVPELRPLAGLRAGFRDGPQILWFRTVAENLVSGVQYVEHAGVEGQIAEFGCMTGRTAQVIAAAMEMVQSDRTLHLFDSFEGLPDARSEPDLQNIHVRMGAWGPGTCKGISPEQLRRKVVRFIPGGAAQIHQGWFSDTLPTLDAGTRFAMIHIDSDLYQSAIDVLDFLFTNGSLSPGALILFDDWDCNRASNEHGERRAWQETVERYEVRFSDKGGYGWAGHKVIVHSYVGMPIS